MSRIYFIRPVGMDGPVKIGCSALPAQRLVSYMVWSPLPLEIAASAPGDFGLEAKLHGYFSADHTHSEWFRASPRLLQLIADVRSGVAITSAIDLSSVDPCPNRRWSEAKRTYMAYLPRVRAQARKRGTKIPAYVLAVLREIQSGTATADSIAAIDGFLAPFLSRDAA